jgi:hypothetical protein
LPGIAVEQYPASPAGLAFLTELRDLQGEKDFVDLMWRGDRDGAKELTYEFHVSDPATIAAAELWVMARNTSPVQFLELGIGSRAPLVWRPPEDLVPLRWNLAAVGVDPGLLVPGVNRVRVRLRPIPWMTEGRRTQLNLLELRLRRR